jgi:hypothetical protein
MTADITTDERARVARRTARARRQFLETCGGGTPQTPELTADQIELHAPHLVMLARDVCETWATCGGAVPQQLSSSIMALKSGLQGASATREVADA